MTDRSRYRLVSLGLVSSAGAGPKESEAVLRGESRRPEFTPIQLSNGRNVPFGRVGKGLPAIPEELDRYRSRNNQLLLEAAYQVSRPIDQAIRDFGRDRIGVIIGSSGSGIEEGEKAIVCLRKVGEMPKSYHLDQQDLGSPAFFLAASLDLRGPAYTISTACSSGAKALASARGLIELGLCDAVVCGGADSYSGLTANGFDALGVMSDGFCNPFSANRDGLNLGEGAALFLLSGTEGGVQLLGVGENTDAVHFSAPDPEASGAAECMRLAIQDARLDAGDVDYINLHGTGTLQNDAMEARAITKVFGDVGFRTRRGNGLACSSTKPVTGHTLGAAGAIEAGVCWWLLESRANWLPRHYFDGQYDSKIDPIPLVDEGSQVAPHIILTNSFGFGGSNCSLILGIER